MTNVNTGCRSHWVRIARRASTRNLSARRNASRPALSLLEVIVIIAIIGLLMAMLLPATQAARESVRRLQCQSHLRQIMLAALQYEAAHGCLPPGECDGNSVFVALLPYFEEPGLSDLFQRADITAPARIRFAEIDRTVVRLFLCPSDGAAPIIEEVPGRVLAGTNYAGNSGTWYITGHFDGPFRYWDMQPFEYSAPPVHLADITRGTSQVAGFSEILRSDRTFDLRRVNWVFPHRNTDIDVFARQCEGLPRDPRTVGAGLDWGRGMPWRQPVVSATLYNHVCLPNSPSCIDQGVYTFAAASAASNHPGIVHVVYLDGHIAPIAERIDRVAWRSFAPRF